MRYAESIKIYSNVNYQNNARTKSEVPSNLDKVTEMLYLIII